MWRRCRCPPQRSFYPSLHNPPRWWTVHYLQNYKNYNSMISIITKLTIQRCIHPKNKILLPQTYSTGCPRKNEIFSGTPCTSTLPTHSRVWQCSGWAKPWIRSLVNKFCLRGIKIFIFKIDQFTFLDTLVPFLITELLTNCIINICFIKANYFSLKMICCCSSKDLVPSF